MQAINRGKMLTFAVLAFTIWFHGGLHNTRQVLYIGLHGSYLLYWAGHQFAIPDWNPFGEPATIQIVVTTFTLMGFCYGLPALLAFTNPKDMNPWVAVLCIAVYTLGSALNVGSDWYKAGAKKAGAGMVKDGPYIYSMRPNYFGDWLRYLSFAMVAGRPLAFLLPAVVVLINVREMQKHVIRSIKRYGAPFIEYASRTSAIVPGLWPAMSCAKADGEEEKAK